MLNFNGTFDKVERKLIKENKTKKEVTSLKIETSTYGDNMELSKQLPPIYDIVSKDEHEIMKKAIFDLPVGNPSMTISNGDEEVSIKALKSMLITMKYNKDGERILTFDIVYDTGENSSVDHLLGHSLIFTI